MPLVIHLQTEDGGPFSIAREMVVIISDEKDFAISQNNKSPFTNTLWTGIDKWIPSLINTNHISKYPLPNNTEGKVMKMGLENYDDMSYEELLTISKIKSLLVPYYPTINNYAQFYHYVLWLNEIGAEIMLQKYNMENVTVTCHTYRNQTTLELEVPGLAEKRPSLIARDVVNIRLHSEHIAYKGVIAIVKNSTIVIEGIRADLINVLKNAPATKLDVSFQLGRLVYERMHAGVDKCVSNKMAKCLFPSLDLIHQIKPVLHHIDNEFFNPCIFNNEEQKIAVKNILNCTSGSAPFIVFGPPGTGKTVTIVEAILQIKKHIKNAKILVCAPANAACDMLAIKLINYCNRNELIRVHSESRDWSSVPTSLRPYSNYCEEQGYYKVQGLELNKYDIVIMTLISSGRYYNQQYFPDFLFIDEAAQAMEPEAAVAIGLLSVGKQLILAGDPKQLGPQCSSAVAMKYTLGTSILERLMKNPLYKYDNSNFITMLKKNFRAHPVVLQLPNELFYDNQLQAVSFAALNDPIAKIFIYHKIDPCQYKQSKASTASPGEPVEFCAIFAKEKREGRSPSYFNQSEIEMVVQYVRALTRLTECKVTCSDIGIVTPYMRQVYRIKDRLKEEGYEDIEVGTTEVFQGREKRVIIISTVRAQHSLLLHDHRYKLGFIKNEKRFNVALTRARSKLIIIGCPNVLRYDPNWLKYIEFCEAKNAYFGAKFDRRTDAIREDIANRIGKIIIE